VEKLHATGCDNRARMSQIGGNAKLFIVDQ